ncbi:MAG: hypothetical protein CMJ76_08460 [Planctomycetaceae bacterium]|nr:hypothetical protein [Planctomycetaceae bacterium]
MKTDRRDFLHTSGATGLGALISGKPCPVPGSGPVPQATADSVILLWMGGGMASTETFDPKQYTAYNKGIDSSRILSTFPAIDTVCDHIKISKGLEKIASVMDRATLIRSYTPGDLGHIQHWQHQYHWHTGHLPQPNQPAPHIGSVIAKTIGSNNPAIPAFIDIGQRFMTRQRQELKAFHTAGFLGSEYGPLFIPFPGRNIPALQTTTDRALKKSRPRYKPFRTIENSSPICRLGSNYQKDSLHHRIENTYRLLSSPAVRAFDLSLEPKDSFDIYNTGRFGRGCLLARRLVEAGARFIEVTTEYIPFANWDTHENGHTSVARLKRAIDGPITQLVLDLEKRGLLNRTMIVLASEFSRAMVLERPHGTKSHHSLMTGSKIEQPQFYGMHRHFTGAGSVLMFGGGIKGGHLHGVTADERPCTTIKNHVKIEDLHATIYKALGISPALAYKSDSYFLHVTQNGQGMPIDSLFA